MFSLLDQTAAQGKPRAVVSSVVQIRAIVKTDVIGSVVSFLNPHSNAYEIRIVLGNKKAVIGLPNLQVCNIR